MILLRASVWEIKLPRWSTQLHPHCEMTEYITVVPPALHENQTCCCLEFGKGWIIPFQIWVVEMVVLFTPLQWKIAQNSQDLAFVPWLLEKWWWFEVCDLPFWDFSIQFMDTSTLRRYMDWSVQTPDFFLGKNWYMMFTSPTLKGQDC